MKYKSLDELIMAGFDGGTEFDAALGELWSAWEDPERKVLRCDVNVLAKEIVRSDERGAMAVKSEKAQTQAAEDALEREREFSARLRTRLTDYRARAVIASDLSGASVVVLTRLHSWLTSELSDIDNSHDYLIAVNDMLDVFMGEVDRGTIDISTVDGGSVQGPWQSRMDVLEERFAKMEDSMADFWIQDDCLPTSQSPPPTSHTSYRIGNVPGHIPTYRNEKKRDQKHRDATNWLLSDAKKRGDATMDMSLQDRLDSLEKRFG